MYSLVTINTLCKGKKRIRASYDDTDSSLIHLFLPHQSRLLSCLLMFLGSLCCKQYEPRLDCSSLGRPIWVRCVFVIKICLRKIRQAVKSTRYGLRSFPYEAARITNCLPNDLRLADYFSQFKRLPHAWDGDICGCPSC